MKRILGGMLLRLLVMSTVFFIMLPLPMGQVWIGAGTEPELNEEETAQTLNTPTPTRSGAALMTNTAFPGVRNLFSLRFFDNGIFIHRSENIIHGPDDIFFGDVMIDTRDFTQNDFEFQGLVFVNGEWQETNLLALYPSHSRLSVRFEMRKYLPAARYGIRARAYETVLGLDGTWIRRPVTQRNFETDELEYVQAFYTILYADDLRYISGMDQWGRNRINVREWGLGQNVMVTMVPNAGAMNKGLLPPNIVRNNHAIGNLDVMGASIEAGITPENINVRILRNRDEIPASQFPRWVTPQGVMLEIPQNLATGRYVVYFNHTSNSDIFGTFIIDNSPPVVTAPADLSALVIVFLILGTIVAAGALGLFLAPKIMHRMQERRYSRMENTRYMERDGSKVDHHYKAQTALDSLKHSREKVYKDGDHKSKSRGFLNNMKEAREKREIAREAGMTMEQYREFEAEQQKAQEAKERSFAAVREEMEEKKPEAAPTIEEQQQHHQMKKEGEVEFELLESVAQDAPVTEESIVQTVIQPNVQEAKSIFAGLRSLTGEDEDK